MKNKAVNLQIVFPCLYDEYMVSDGARSVKSKPWYVGQWLMLQVVTYNKQ